MPRKTTTAPAAQESPGTSDLLPASSLLPEAFPGKPDFYWSERDIKNGKERIYLTSEIHAGWKYFTASQEVRISKEFPEGYEADIGYKYKHGPGKVDPKTGQPMEEKAKPTMIWMFRAWHVEREEMVVAVVGSSTLQKRIAKLLDNEEFGMTPRGICNFYLTVYRDPEAEKAADTYDATAALRVCGNQAAIEEAAKPFYAERYWRGLNPLEPDQEPPAALPKVPATARDENGADIEASVSDGDDDW